MTCEIFLNSAGLVRHSILQGSPQIQFWWILQSKLQICYAESISLLCFELLNRIL